MSVKAAARKGPAKRKCELTPRQKLFVRHYVISSNATRAAITAGYSAKNAGKIGPRLVGKSRIQRAIEVSLARRAHQIDKDCEAALAGIKAISTTTLADFYKFNASGIELKDVSEIDPKKLAAIQSIQEVQNQSGSSVNVKLHPKVPAAEFLLKFHGKYTERNKTEHDVSERLEDLIAGSMIDRTKGDPIGGEGT